MTAELQTAVANEALELAYQFRQNAALKHGLPDCRRYALQGKPETTPPERKETNAADATATEAAGRATPSPGGGVATQPAQSLWRRAAPFLLTAATGSAVPLAAYWALEKEPPPITQPAPAAPTDGSLLQYLQDQGKHLPEGVWQTK